MWTNPTLLRLLLAQLLSVIGDGAYFVAVAWWLKMTTGSDAPIGLLALGESIAAVTCGPIGGVLADRLDRRRLMIGCDLARAAALAAPLALLLLGKLEPWHVIATGVVLTGIGAGFGPALNATLPSIVPHDSLAAANSANQVFSAAGAVAGPAIGGILVALGGSGSAIGANLGSFVASAALIALCRFPGQGDSASERPPLWRDLTAGLRYFATEKTLLSLLLLAAILNFVLAPLSILMPALAHDVLGTDARGFGVLEAMLPAGLIVGGIVAPMVKVRRAGPAIVATIAVAGICLALLSAVRRWEAAAVLLVAMGACFSATNLLAVQAFQVRIPTALQGRAFAALGTIAQGLRPAGIAAGSAAIAVVGVVRVMAASGVLLSVSALAGGLAPGIRRLRLSPDDET